MAEGYIDLSGVYAAIRSSEQSVKSYVHQETSAIRQQLNSALNEIDYLKGQLVQMEKNARMRAALQKAVTEIIRVRQELDDKFGTHKEIRQNMLGIIQATDSGLITKETISRVSEELMLSAPRYWLAPCLIAIAAWIADNKDLANKAIKEAVKRDNEKTSLLMALILRRVNAQRIIHHKEPTNSTFLWLSRYFALQNPLDMNASIVSYVDAYANGIFGQDNDELCNDSIKNWMAVLGDKNPNFKEEQIKYWTAIFTSFVPTYNTPEFQALKYLSPQYPIINHFVSKIDAITNERGVKNYLSNITHAEIDQAALIEQIDNNLMTLVTNYDEEEVDLRDEEQYLSYVKEYEGDEEKAKQLMSAIHAARIQPTVDFAARLSLAITDKNSSSSVRKTAVKLLLPYISEAFTNFINLNENAYPEEIELKFKEAGFNNKYGNDFAFTIKDGTETDEIIKQVETTYDQLRDKRIAEVVDDEAIKTKKKGTIWLCFFILVIPLFVGLYFCSKVKKMLVANAKLRAEIKSYYDKRKTFHTQQIKNAVAGKIHSDAIVNAFVGEGVNTDEIFKGE